MINQTKAQMRVSMREPSSNPDIDLSSEEVRIKIAAEHFSEMIKNQILHNPAKYLAYKERIVDENTKYHDFTFFLLRWKDAENLTQEKQL